MLTFSVLVDDDVHLPGCLPERGLALLLECDGLRVLFDSGRGRALRHNAAVMGIDLGSLTHVVLSHGHYDHVGGIGSLPVYSDPSRSSLVRTCSMSGATSCRCCPDATTSTASRATWIRDNWRREGCSLTVRPSRSGCPSGWCSSGSILRREQAKPPCLAT
jgi:7,8-dihydropterin-6-yl-methyl-4-(beta-D-ribofuranosyl)aminobenzene 5'-phosphate synthase